MEETFCGITERSGKKVRKSQEKIGKKIEKKVIEREKIIKRK